MNKASASPFASRTGAQRARIRQRKEPQQARAQHTVEAVLAATLQVLLREGYSKLTTTRVAERAGVSVGTLYQYFPDKRSLVAALKVQYFEKLLAELKAAVERAVPLPLPEAVRVVIDALLAVKREKLPLARALRGPLAEFEGRGIARDAREHTEALLLRLLTARASTLPEPELSARVLAAAMEGALSVAVDEEPELLSSPAYAEELAALALGFLERRPAKAPRRRRE